MKKNYPLAQIIIFLPFFIIAGIGIYGCSKNNDDLHESEFENPYRENILGKWKLIKLITYQNYDYQNSDTTDYSEKNIVYSFYENNRLNITGNISESLSEGEHFYQYTKSNVCPTCLPRPNLTIDTNNTFFCSAPLLQKEMTISGEKVVGQITNESGLIIENGTILKWTKIFVLNK